MTDYKLLCLAAMAGCVWTSFSLGQEQTHSAPLLLETVSVVGYDSDPDIQLSSQSLAASIVDLKELQALKFQQPQELLQRISGVSMVRNLRIPVSEKSYTVPLIDGVALGSPYSGSTSSIGDINPRNIERVEVVKGPGSALYSSNAFGGTINTITRQPPEQGEQSVDIELGNYQRSRLAFQAAGQFESTGYFFDVSRQRMQGYRDEYQDDADRVSAKGQFQVAEENTLVLAGEFIDRYERHPGALTETEYREDPQQVGGTFGSDEDVKIRMLSLQDTHRFTDVSQLSFSAVYREEDSEGIDYHTGPTDAVRDDGEVKLVYQQQFEALQGRALVGAGYTYGRSNFTRYRAGQNQQINWQQPSTDSISHTNVEAVFAEYAFSPITPLELSLGVRREKILLDSESNLVSTDVDADFDSTDPRLGLVWKVSDKHQLWASYSEGFYAPNTRQLYTDDNANPNLAPEQLESQQLGVRGLIYGAMQYSLTYYQSDIEDYIVQENFFDDFHRPYRRFSNAGLLDISGVELDLDYSVNEWLSAALAYTYSDNHYVEYTNPYTRDDLSGESLSRSPEHHVNTRLAFTPLDGLRLELEWDFISEYYTNDNNSSDPEGAFQRDDIVHLRVSYRTENIKWWLHGLNLTGTLEEDVSYSRGQRFYEINNDTAVYAGVSYTF